MQIASEEDGRLDFPIPTPTTRIIFLVGRHGSKATYLARSLGTAMLAARHTRFRLKSDPRF